MTCFVSSVFQKGVSFYRDHFRTMMPILLIFAAIQAVVYVQLLNGAAQISHPVFWVLFTFFTLLIGAAVIIYCSGSVTRARPLTVMEIVDDLKKSLLSVTVSLLFVIVAFMVLFSLGTIAVGMLSLALSLLLPFKVETIFTASLILLAWPLVLSLRFFLAPFVAFQGKTQSFGLKESWCLTKSHGMCLAALVLGITMIELLIGYCMNFLMGGGSYLSAIILGGLDGFFFMPFLMITVSFLYQELCAKKCALNSDA